MTGITQGAIITALEPAEILKSDETDAKSKIYGGSCMMRRKTETLAKSSPGLAVYSRTELVRKNSPQKRRKLFTREKKQGPTRKQIHEFLSQWLNVLPEQEARMLRGVFALSETCAREIMTPLSEMFAVPIGTSLEQIRSMIRELDYSYIPVYEERIDRLTGIVSVLDILYANDETEDVGGLIRSAYYIPETKLIGQLLEELRVGEEPIALVIDEYGGCVGLVTLEDILEQIVGDIGPLDHGPSYTVEATSSSSWVVDARTDIDIVSRAVGIEIPRDRCDTIGGFVLKLLGRIPEQGEKVEYEGKELIVAEVFDYGISEIHINNIPQQDSRRRKR